MSGIGLRLRQERERLGLSQKVFGEIGGVEANAQGKYESGGRAPKADYLSRVAARGVDVLYVLTGAATPIQLENLSHIEEKVLGITANVQGRPGCDPSPDLYFGRAFILDEWKSQAKPPGFLTLRPAN